MAERLLALGLRAPAVLGLNTEVDDSFLSHQWASALDNAVFNEDGNTASRKGNISVTQSAFVGEAIQLHRYVKLSGNEELLYSTDTQIFTDTVTPSDITGTLSFTAGNWQFANFNGDVYAAQEGQDLAIYSGTSFDYVTATSGTVPEGSTILAAYGRLWGTDDTATVVKFSDLLDGDAWATGSSGSLNLASVWTEGVDKIVALSAFNGNLVIFSENNILIYSGADVTPASNLQLVEEIRGIGCIARDSIQQVGNDIYFLSKSGLRSLGRTIQEKSGPLGDVSFNIRDYLIEHIEADTPPNIRSVYVEDRGLYLLLLPDNDVIFSFDLKRTTQGNPARISRWKGIKAFSVAVDESNDIFFGKDGHISRYSGYSDEGNPYQLLWETPWLNMDESERIYLLKRLAVYTKSKGRIELSVKWGSQFSSLNKKSDKDFIATDNLSISEYNEAEYGTGEYTTAKTFIEQFKIPASGSGTVHKFQFSYKVDGAEISIPRISIYTKRGKII